MELYDLDTIDSFGKKFADATVAENVEFLNPDEVCTKCFQPTHRLRGAPKTIEWEEGSDVIPDFIRPGFSPTFIVTQPVKEAFEATGLTGYTAWQAGIKERRSPRKSKFPIVPSPYPGPPLWDIYVSNMVHVVPQACTLYDKGRCEVCGRDRYSVVGEAEEQFFVVDRSSWNGEDFMLPVEVNAMFVTERVVEVIRAHEFTNVRVRHCARMSD